MALARQIGVLHQRIAPAGALSLRQPLKLGDPTPELALSGWTIDREDRRRARRTKPAAAVPVRPTARSAKPVAGAALGSGRERSWLDIVLASDGELYKHEAFVREKGLTKFPYVVSEHLGRSYGVSKLPYAVLIDEGVLISAAIFGGIHAYQGWSRAVVIAISAILFGRWRTGADRAARDVRARAAGCDRATAAEITAALEA